MDSIINQITAAISNASTPEQLEQIRSHYLGIGSKINEDIKRVGNYSTLTERQNIYQLIINTRNEISGLIDNKRKQLVSNKLVA